MTRLTLLVGNDTDAAGTGGLRVFGVDGNEWVRGRTIDVPSPTYLARHDDLMFAVSETNPSRVHSFLLDRGRFPASLTHVSSAEVGRDGACHVAVAPGGGFVLTACYVSGSVTTHRVLPDGRLTSVVDVIDFTGTGPVPDRQEAAHAHQVVFDDDVAMVPDLGSDVVHRLRLLPDGTLMPLGDIPMPPGFGPRHLAVHGDRMFVVGELSGQLWVGRRTAEGFAREGVLPASAFEGQFPAAIRIAGSRLYVSLRGRNTIAEFTLDAPLPRPVREFAVGPWPRDFVVSGGHLWVGHQRGENVVAYCLEEEVPLQRCAIPAPAPAGLLLVE